MKVYLLSAGSYSDYRIEKVFLKRENAVEALFKENVKAMLQYQRWFLQDQEKIKNGERPPFAFDGEWYWQRACKKLWTNPYYELDNAVEEYEVEDV
jgi:hypothetical protein